MSYLPITKSFKPLRTAFEDVITLSSSPQNYTCPFEPLSRPHFTCEILNKLLINLIGYHLTIPHWLLAWGAGGIGFFDFLVLDIFEISFLVFVFKIFRFLVLVSNAVFSFSFFNIWFLVFINKTSSFSVFVICLSSS